MPLAPAIAAALTTPAARTWGLFVDGLDVSKEPGAAPRYGTVWPSIALRIAAPGGACSLEWYVDDQAGLLAFDEGQEVRLVRLGQTNRGGAVDAPWFRGTVEVATATALGIGRQWHVRATGLDAIPDWTVTDYPVIVSVAGGAQDLAWVVQSIVAACSNRGDIGAIVGPSLQGTVIWPTGALGGPAGGAVSLAAA